LSGAKELVKASRINVRLSFSIVRVAGFRPETFLLKAGSADPLKLQTTTHKTQINSNIQF
jgi:hypothetical protein